MKKYILTLLLILSIALIHAQPVPDPGIRQGTAFSYNINVGVQEFFYMLHVDSLTNDFCRISWRKLEGSNGAWVMYGSSLNNSKNGYWQPPAADEETVIPGWQTVVLFPRNLLVTV